MHPGQMRISCIMRMAYPSEGDKTAYSVNGLETTDSRSEEKGKWHPRSPDCPCTALYDSALLE